MKGIISEADVKSGKVQVIAPAGFMDEADVLQVVAVGGSLSDALDVSVDDPMADLQLVSDDLGELQRQAAEFTPNKDKKAVRCYGDTGQLADSPSNQILSGT